MNRQAKINWSSGNVETTESEDRTFIVTVAGIAVGRWPTRAIADRNADSIRSHQPEKG
jgi:hypothetical protein